MGAVASRQPEPPAEESPPIESVVAGGLELASAPAAVPAGRVGWGGIAMDEELTKPLSPAGAARSPVALDEPRERPVHSRFRVLKMTVSGRLREPLIQKELERKRATFESCHLPAGQRRAKGVRTALVVRWIVGRTGVVSNVSMVESELLPSGDTCMVRALEGLELPAPEGGIASVFADLVFTQL
jgi:hypothetical protein